MSAPKSTPNKSGRLFEVLDRSYRNYSYRPARYYLTWYFLTSLASMIGWVIGSAYVLLDSGFDSWMHLLPLYAIGFLCSAFLVILSTYNGLISSSLHLHLGDRGIFSLGRVPSTSPVVTKSSFVCLTPEQKALYDKKLHGARITRYFVWRWNRKGGNEKWPGQDGGKKEGYFAVVARTWETYERLDPAGKSTGEVHVLEWHPCPTCNRDAVADPDVNAWKPGWVHVPAMTTEQLQKMAMEPPGYKVGGVLEVPMQIMPDRYPEEIPFALAQQIQHDVEYRASSRVDVGYDPLPEVGGMGTVLTHNSEIELFGLQQSSKRQRHQSVELHQNLAVVHQLQGGNIGGGPGQH